MQILTYARPLINMAIEQFGMGSIEATHNVTRGVYTWVLRDIFEHKILFVTVAERSMVKVSLSVSTYVDCFVCDKGLENKYVWSSFGLCLI